MKKIDRIYSIAKANGWHDEDLSNEHFLCLVISELMEAVEADRKGRRAEKDKFVREFEYTVTAENLYLKLIYMERNLL